ncbi:Tryptophan--tRNA ligase, mitochondrial [Paramarasmius palmivorus]|uniref:tryptophan--tRNA ligase n=1 Tax=Paramarasmius palmivorus TaxID=297713 RepID=A0AAW0DAK5_9AGAR
MCLGNYLGALSNWVTLQEESDPGDELLFTIVGWHALTLPQNPKQLKESRMDMLAVLLAIGIDPNRSIVFHQDHNPAHTELAWILNCITPMGKLRRMTTWKSRLAASQSMHDNYEVDETSLNAGLFTYPVLQAADILVYRATHVPVGEDQTQHLELCRDLADQFNRTFKVEGQGPLFPLPVQLSTPSKRILSLRDPTSKMSKSHPDVSSRILLTDTDAEIASKIRSAVTDSISGITYDPENRPGTSNLLTILAACRKQSVDITARDYEASNHGALKRDVTEAVQEMLKGPREEFRRLRQDEDHLDSVARTGALRAHNLTTETMRRVRERIGAAAEKAWGSEDFENFKLSHGVVEEAGRPEGYSVPEMSWVNHDALYNDYDDFQMVYTTQPSIFLDTTLEKYPDGWTECLISGYAKREITETPGFPQPIARPPETRHRITECENGEGLGMFAAVDMKMGDLILSERAFMISPVAARVTIKCPTRFTEEQKRQALLHEREKQVQMMFDRMPQDFQRDFLALYNSHKQDGSGPITGIIRTNGFGIDGLEDPVPPGAHPYTGIYSGVFNDLSRLNHSCRPNTIRTWDMASFSLRLFAARDIKKDEELFTQYTEILSPPEERQQDLAPFGFRCSCPSCKNPLLSLSRRLEVIQSTPSPMQLVAWLMDYDLPDDYLVNRSLRQLELIQEEGLETTKFHVRHLRFLFVVYCALGDAKRSLAYLDKYERLEIARKGKRGFPGSPVSVILNSPMWNRRNILKSSMERLQLKEHWASLASKTFKSKSRNHK